MFSKACEYGIRAVIFIAWRSKDGQRPNVHDISEAIGSPEAFTAKVLQQLVGSGVVESMRGPAGGFCMSRQSMLTTMLSDVVQAIDGDNIFKGCGLGLPHCSEEMPCPVHNRFKSIREELRLMLESTPVASLSAGLDEKLTFLRTPAIPHQ